MTPSSASHYLSQRKRCARLLRRLAMTVLVAPQVIARSGGLQRRNPCKQVNYSRTKKSIRLHHVDFLFYTLRKIYQYISKLLYLKTFRNFKFRAISKKRAWIIKKDSFTFRKIVTAFTHFKYCIM